jgi:putative ABC transport system permease protein
MFFSSHLWQKVKTDLLSHKSRTLLEISSITIGLFMVGTLLGMMDLQLGSMDNAHQQSQPSHISLILKQDVDFAVAEQIKQIAGVANVDRVTQFTVQFKTPNNPQWQTGTVLFRPDYQVQKYDRMTLLSGLFPQDSNIAVERLSARFAALKMADVIEFATPTGSEKLTVNGIIRHPFVKPPAFGGQLHFFIAPELAPTFGIPAHTFRQLLVQIKPPYSAEQARLIAAEIREKLAKSGIGVNATLLQNPQQHWGRAIFSGIHLVLTVMAWADFKHHCRLDYPANRPDWHYEIAGRKPLDDCKNLSAGSFYSFDYRAAACDTFELGRSLLQQPLDSGFIQYRTARFCLFRTGIVFDAGRRINSTFAGGVVADLERRVHVRAASD